MAADRVLIIGGGVSGLATAYFLSRLGIRSTIIEKANRLGGLIQTDVIAGCQLEAGPDSYLAAKPAVTNLAQEVPGLKDQIIGSNDAGRRIFIARDGKLVAMPKGMVMMVPGQWSPVLRSNLLSVGSKLRLLAETRSSPRERLEDVSVGQFVEEHFGSEVLELIAEPLLSGVYGGDPAKLSAKSVLPRFVGYEQMHGSLIRAVRRDARQRTGQSGSLFLSLRDGMQTLTDSLAAAIHSHAAVIHAEITQVDRSGSGWRVHAGGESHQAGELVLACPTYVCGGLLEKTTPALASELFAIPYSSAILVTLVYARATLGHPLNGFGFLVPHRFRKTIAASTWVSSKFPMRIRPNLAALRGFIVAERATELMNAPEGALIELVREDFRRLMGVITPPLFSTVHKWPNSMPQYVVGHAKRQQDIARMLKMSQGLFLSGNAYDGIGIPDCVRMAEETAKQVRARIA
ncbi:MAG TPA: protoporphyrinogen oxidase [Bryobacteraceae bacterium]